MPNKESAARVTNKQVAKSWLRERTFALSEQSWMERIDRRRDALDRACLGKKGAVLTTKSYGAAQTWLLLEPAPPCQGYTVRDDEVVVAHDRLMSGRKAGQSHRVLHRSQHG